MFSFNILKLLRTPEALLWGSYRRSDWRKSLRRGFPTFRSTEDNLTIARRLEERYGGREGSLQSMRRFIERNVLCTLLLVLLAIYAGQVVLDSIMEVEPAQSLRRSSKGIIDRGVLSGSSDLVAGLQNPAMVELPDLELADE